MKKYNIVVIALLMVVISACEESAKIKPKIQTIDGCEYIVSENGYGNVASHKGNCSNPIHDCK